MDNLTDEQRKQILKDICDEEVKKHNFNINIDIVTVEEYESKIFKQPIKLQKLNQTFQLASLAISTRGVHFSGTKTKKAI